MFDEVESGVDVMAVAWVHSKLMDAPLHVDQDTDLGGPATLGLTDKPLSTTTIADQGAERDVAESRIERAQFAPAFLPGALEHNSPNTALAIIGKSIVNRRPTSESFRWQMSPTTTCAGQIDNRLEKLAVVFGGPSPFREPRFSQGVSKARSTLYVVSDR